MSMNDPSAAQPSRPAAARAVPAKTWRDSAQFLRGFMRSPARVGSVAPSSRRLEQRLVRQGAVAQARTVVELGPGTGGTTAALLRAMPAGARLLAIELDAQFHRHLANHLADARLSLELGAAQDLEEILAARRLPAPDVIVSGIPFSTMPPAMSDHIARTVARMLAPGGRFVAYQVRAHVAGFVSPYLGPPRREWEWVNLPPVRVFTWEKPAG